MRKKVIAVLAALAGVFCLGGCGNGDAGQTAASAVETIQEESSADTESQAETQTEEQAEAQQEKAADAAILVVSFGTSYNDNRDLTIGAIEEAIAGAFPEYDVRRAFTSQIIIDKLEERDGLEIDNVTEALDRAEVDGIRELIVQPTHLMDGYEYTDLVEELSDYVDRFEKIFIGTPLLTDDADYDAVIAAITEHTASYDDGETAICFMGHGTEADSNAVYTALQEKLTASGYENYYIGTVEAEPSLEDVIAALQEKGSYTKVVLEPLMVVAGDHANNDMAGEEEDSWKTVLEKEGYEVECILEGLGQIPEIQELYVQHVQDAIDSQEAFTGIEQEESAAASGITEDGSYLIEVESSSSMFNVEKAVLTVEDGTMNAVITLGGTGYSHLYMGTSEEAAQAAQEEWIPFAEDENGAYTYTIPVRVLDQPLDCAAYSIRKEQWYDRQLTFLSSTAVSADAETEEDVETTEAAESQAENLQETGKVAVLEDGTYALEITFSGGSGKAQILSPARATITDGNAVATVQWNSPNYDYMVVDGEKYLPVNTEGDSTFEFPVVLDEEMTVIGDTVAMSTPHEIEYVITFHSDTAERAE